MAYPKKAAKEKFKLGWVIGALLVAVVLLFIGRITSEGIRENNNVPNSQETGIDEIIINENQPVTITGGEGETVTIPTTRPDSAVKTISE